MGGGGDCQRWVGKKGWERVGRGGGVGREGGREGGRGGGEKGVCVGGGGSCRRWSYKSQPVHYREPIVIQCTSAVYRKTRAYILLQPIFH